MTDQILMFYPETELILITATVALQLLFRIKKNTKFSFASRNTAVINYPRVYRNYYIR